MSQASVDPSHPNLYPDPVEYEGRRLEGKVVVVFGASSGIGAAAVTRFAREGALVVAAARRADRLDQLVTEVRSDGGEATAATCDVRVEDDIARTVGETVSRYGQLDGAFNNAGVPGGGRPIHDLSAEALDETLAVNLRGVALCLKHEVLAMRDQARAAVLALCAEPDTG